MANSYTKQIIEDGPRNIVVNLTGVLDSNDQPMTTVIAPSDCSAFIPRTFRLDCVQYSTPESMQVQLWSEGIPDTMMLAVTGQGEMEYYHAGGLQNTAYAPTGGIRVMTSGYVSGTQTYSLLLHLVKIGVA